MSLWGKSRFLPWDKNPAALPNAQSTLSNILLLLRPGETFLVQGGRRRWQWTLNLSLGTRLSLPCSASTAMLSPPWLPVPVQPCPFIAGRSHVWNELIQNVGYATKNSENSLIFTALNVNWKKSKCRVKLWGSPLGKPFLIWFFSSHFKWSLSWGFVLPAKKLGSHVKLWSLNAVLNGLAQTQVIRKHFLPVFLPSCL